MKIIIIINIIIININNLKEKLNISFDAKDVI